MWLFSCVLCGFIWRSESYPLHRCAVCNTLYGCGITHRDFQLERCLLYIKKNWYFNLSTRTSLPKLREKLQQNFIDQMDIRNKLFLSFTYSPRPHGHVWTASRSSYIGPHQSPIKRPLSDGHAGCDSLIKINHPSMNNIPAGLYLRPLLCTAVKDVVAM